MSKITLSDTAGDVAILDTVADTLTFTAAVVTPPVTPPSVTPPPVTPPPITPPTTGNTAVITGTLANGTAINVTVAQGSRVPLVAGSITSGSVVFHADGYTVCLENCYAGITADLAGTFTVTVGTQQLFSGPLTIWGRGRTRPFWVSQPTLGTLNQKLFPSYGAGSGSASESTGYAAADNSPMGIGVAHATMGDTGERGDLGLLPAWDADYIVNPTAANAAVVFGMGQASSPFSFHVVDPVTNLPISITTYPHATCTDVYTAAQGNPILPITSATPLSLLQAAAHAPAFCALAAQLYGCDYFKEELTFWALYLGRLWQSPDYCLTDGPTSIKHGQTRGKGWTLRTLAQAAVLSDNTTLFTAWMNASAAEMVTIWPAQTGLQIDQVGEIAADYTYGDWAPFQMDYLVAAIGYAIQLGFTAYQPVLDYFAALTFARMGLPVDTQPVTQHEFAVLYNVALVNGTWNAAVIATGTQSPHVLAALAYPENSVDLQSALNGLALGTLPEGGSVGDFGGYPESPSGTGYSAIFRGNVVYCAKYATNQTVAQATLAKFLLYDREIYTTDPKYNLIQPA